MCVLGVTAYLNHEKMVDMEQTLAQMKGTRYVTEAQTADTETEETERMPSVAVETVMGNVEKQELSAEAAGTQEDSAAQQAETAQEAQGAQGTAEPAENATANAQQELQRDRKLRGYGGSRWTGMRDAAARRWRRRRRARIHGRGPGGGTDPGHDDSCRKLIGGECAGGSSADRGADVSVAGIL